MTPVWKEVSEPAIRQTTPVVSVAMLAYNHASFIAEAIEGVAMQKTDFPIELVIGVDCCPDKTLEIVLRYQKLHPQLIRVLVPEQRLGMHKNCYLVLQACRGKYLAMCEGDDFWVEPNKIAKQVQVLEGDPILAGCFHDCHVLYQQTGLKKLRIGERRIDPTPDTASLIQEKNITTCSMLFRNCISISNLEQLTRNVVQIDYVMCLLVSEKGLWQYLPTPMAVYRFHDSGIWGGCSAAERRRQNVNFSRALIASGEFGAYRRLLQSAIRNERRLLSLDLARERKLLHSLYQWALSTGCRRNLQGRHVACSEYWKTFFHTVLIRLGLNGPVVRLWHMLSDKKGRLS